MFILNARFASLLILCGIAVSPLYSNGSNGVHAAVIARGRQREGAVTSNDSSDKQAFFSSPSHRGKRSSFKHKRPQGADGHPHKSIVIPSDTGSKYVVSHSRRASTPEWIANPGNQTSFNGTAAPDPTAPNTSQAGTVALMSSTDKDAKPVGWITTGNINGTDLLEATQKQDEATVWQLIDAVLSPSTSSRSNKDDKYCNLCKAGPTEMLCATFDRKDMYDQVIRLTPQNNDPSKSNMTQLFLFDGATGKLAPMSEERADGFDKTDKTFDMDDSAVNSTTSSASAPPHVSSTPRRRRDGSSTAHFQTQNVTLIFVPQNASSMNIKTDNSTSTVTQTVTLYSSGYPTSSGAHVAAASAASSSGAIASSAPSGSLSGMSVELVGPVASSPSQSSASIASSSVFAKAAATSSQALSSSGSIVFGAASATASPSASASLNPAVIAASLASSYSTAARYTPSSAASPSGSGAAFGAASASAGPSAVSGGQPGVQSVLAAAAWRREAVPAMATVNTDPYTWKFSSESR